MKILVYGLPRSFGGIGALIDNMVICNEQAGRPLDFDFLVSPESPYFDDLQQRGYCVVPLPKLTDPLRYRRALAEVFRRTRYDAVWINNTSKVDMCLPALAKAHGARVITHSHGSANEARGLKRTVFAVLEWLNRGRFFRMVDIPLACNEAAADYFYRGFSRRDEVEIIRNGIFVDRFAFREETRQAVRQELGLAENEVALCSCGRLSAVKNNQLLIRVITRLPPCCRLFLIGTGEQEEELRTLAEKLAAGERVRFLGFRNDVDRLLCGMDIYAMPSLHEGMPFSLIEAQASGLPCAVSDTVSREVDLTGLVRFLPLNDEAAWAAALEAMTPEKGEKDRSRGAALVHEAGYAIEDSFRRFVALLAR